MDDEADVGATPSGLIQCLRMLSEEASSLRLSRTFAALQEAIEVCREEVSVAFRDCPAPLQLLH